MTLLAALPLDSERPDSWPLELADRLGFMGEDRESVMSLLDVDPNRVASAWKPLVQLPGPGRGALDFSAITPGRISR